MTRKREAMEKEQEMAEKEMLRKLIKKGERRGKRKYRKEI